MCRLLGAGSSRDRASWKEGTKIAGAGVGDPLFLRADCRSEMSFSRSGEVSYLFSGLRIFLIYTSSIQVPIVPVGRQEMLRG
jgi:hypothetical protein